MKFRKVEFWLATAIFILFIYHFLNEAKVQMAHTGPNSFIDHMESRFRESGLSFNYLINILYPNLAYCLGLYGAFIFLNNFVIPRYYHKKDYTRIALLVLAAFIGVLSIFSVASFFQDMYADRRLAAYFINMAPMIAAAFALYLLYAILKKVIEYYLRRPKTQNTLGQKIMKDSLIALCVWLIGLLFIFSTHNQGLLRIWLAIIPYAYILYQAALYWFIPRFYRKLAGYDSSTRKIYPYFTVLRALLYSFVLYVPFLALQTSMGRIDGAMAITSWLLVTLGVLLLAFLMYHRNQERILELLSLKSELGKVSSNLQFLRSQINPHFLFNALNTLYGTSMQENAPKTGEGIQKLGDMMRFMLHENHQDRIGLAREIDYLNDYIHLQRLRLAESESIRIETVINEEHCPSLAIAPMLLIPFVENAFKHGISLQEPSWIKIALKCDQKQLYFDIYNSIHRKNAADPEKQSQGIGLENVRQRLGLIYPRKHELTIRENDKEYFVHLTIKLA